jgi:hypothetical protein
MGFISHIVVHLQSNVFEQNHFPKQVTTVTILVLIDFAIMQVLQIWHFSLM